MKKKNILIVSVMALLLIGGVALAMVLIYQPTDKSVEETPSVGENFIEESMVIDKRETMSLEEYLEIMEQLHANIPSFTNFNFDNYGLYLELYSSDIVVGPILTETRAKAKARDVWIEVFGEQFMQNRPAQDIRILYDEANDVWFLAGTLPPDTLGAVPNIFIRGADGQVLAVWMG